MSRALVIHLFLVSFVVFEIPNCVVSQNNEYETCRQPFQCGETRDIPYPFYGGDRPASCGSPGFEISCENGVPLINTSRIIYRVLDINNETQTLRVARDDLWSPPCAQQIINTSVDTSFYNFYAPANDQNITLLYGCSGQVSNPLPNQFNCSSGNGFINGWAFFFTRTIDLPGIGVTCGPQITARVTESAATGLTATPSFDLLLTSLQTGFSIQWLADNRNCRSCLGSGGVCGSDQSGLFACHCANATFPSTCTNAPTQNGSGKGLNFNVQKIAIIAGSLICGLGLLLASIICYLKKDGILQYLKKNTSSNSNVEQFLLSHASLSQKRYSYYEIKKMTKSFKEKLGQGGFGIVYKGELPDGQPVAVKVLTESHEYDDDAQEFINEVASISRTSHVNIVNLLGFCYHRNKRALVYEFMPNKSLDNFIYTPGTKHPAECSLELDKLYAIALGVARGLEYLHRGCNTRIVHFDIKPQNILLDEDFCPKISDFGLAKLFKKKQSIISMLGTRGTIGYIAPEVFSRNFGLVSHKSDVYSYGMMLLEMVGAKKMAEIEPIIQSSENYFPENVYELVLVKNKKIDDLMRDEKEESEMKMLMVGVWCIQTAPSDRPSMSKAVEMLQGSVQSIQMPPKPFFPSAPLLLESLQYSSSTNMETQ